MAHNCKRFDRLQTVLENEIASYPDGAAENGNRSLFPGALTWRSPERFPGEMQSSSSSYTDLRPKVSHVPFGIFAFMRPELIYITFPSSFLCVKL